MNKEELLEHSENLITLPEITLRLQDLLNDKDASLIDIANVVSLDPALTSKILKLANSSFYNFAARIDTLPRAINIIGSDALYSLALANSAVSAFNKVPDGVIDLEFFWRTSVDTALIAKQLTGSVLGNNAERMFVTGLLHNVGELLCVTELPVQAKEVAGSMAGKADSAPFERDIYGFTYHELTADFMKRWSFPPEIYQVVASLEKPQECPFQKEAVILAVARRLACQLSEMQSDGEDDYPLSEAIDRLIAGLNPELKSVLATDDDSIRAAVDYANLEAINVLSILSPKTTSVY